MKSPAHAGYPLESIGDGCAFAVRDGAQWRRLQRRAQPVRVFHHGWVRPPEVMVAKIRSADRLYRTVRECAA